MHNTAQQVSVTYLKRFITCTTETAGLPIPMPSVSVQVLSLALGSFSEAQPDSSTQREPLHPHPRLAKHCGEYVTWEELPPRLSVARLLMGLNI